MFTTQQIIVTSGLLVLAWAIIYGLMCRGGHRKQPPYKTPPKR